MSQLKTICSALPECEGFNSQGWVKSRVMNKRRAAIDLYLKQTATVIPQSGVVCHILIPTTTVPVPYQIDWFLFHTVTVPTSFVVGCPRYYSLNLPIYKPHLSQFRLEIYSVAQCYHCLDSMLPLVPVPCYHWSQFHTTIGPSSMPPLVPVPYYLVSWFHHFRC